MEIQNCSDLPEHIVFDEILPKLPTTDLIKFRAVSKSWSFILFRFVIETLFPSDPHSDTSSDELIVKFVDKKIPRPDRCNSFFTLSYDNLNLRLSFTRDCDEIRDYYTDRFVGSVNGIVVLGPSYTGFYMWNPVTNSFKTSPSCITFLPDYTPVFRNNLLKEYFGCGVCAQSGDIKVVTIRSILYCNVGYNSVEDVWYCSDDDMDVNEQEEEHDFSDASDDFVDEGNGANDSERTTESVWGENEQDFSDASDNMDGDNCDKNEDFSDASDNMDGDYCDKNEDFSDASDNIDGDYCDEKEDFSDASDNIDGDYCDENEDFSDASDDFVDKGDNVNKSARTIRPVPERDLNLLPDYIVEVYSMSTESWRQVAVNAQLFLQFPPYLSMFYPQRGYTNRDTFSWLVCTRELGHPAIVKLLTFNMTTEVFQVTAVPDAIFGGFNYYSTFDVERHGYGDPGRFPFQLLNGTIALVVPSLDKTSFAIWLLLEYGVSDSWTRLCTIGPFPEILQVLGFWKNGNVILESTTGELLLADLFTNKIIQKLQIEGRPGYTQIIPHKETRIVLKGDPTYDLDS